MRRRVHIAAVVVGAVVTVVAAKPARADKIEELVKTAWNAPDLGDRQDAIGALGRSGDRRAIVACARSLLRDRSSLVRANAGLWLRKIVTGTSSATDQAVALAALRRASTNDKSELVRRVAVRALERLSTFVQGTSTPPCQVTSASGNCAGAGGAGTTTAP